MEAFIPLLTAFLLNTEHQLLCPCLVVPCPSRELASSGMASLGVMPPVAGGSLLHSACPACPACREWIFLSLEASCPCLRHLGIRCTGWQRWVGFEDSAQAALLQGQCVWSFGV